MRLSVSGVAGSILSTVGTTYSRAVGAVDYGTRVAHKSEILLDETIETMRAARPLIRALSEAVDDGLLDEMRDTMHQSDSTIRLANTVSRRVNVTLEQLDSLPGAKQVRRIVRAPEDTPPAVAP